MQECSVLVCQQIIQNTLTHIQAARHMEESCEREEQNHYFSRKLPQGPKTVRAPKVSSLC